MKPLFSAFHAAIVAVSQFCGFSALAAVPEVRSLFDGQTLNGWKGDTRYWRVEDGAITAEIPAGEHLNRNEFLFWKDGELRDFELTLEFRISGGPAANSGIQFRSQELPGGDAAGYQADLDDGTEWLGRVYDEHGRALIVERGTQVSIAPDGRRWVDAFASPRQFKTLLKPDNGWNTYQIKAWNSHVEIWINGERVSALDDHQTDAAEYSGKLAFQLHSGPGPAKVQFRNIRLVDLGASELPPSGDKSATPGSRPEVKTAPVLSADGKPLNLNFETGTLEGWKAEGNAWEGQPVKGDTVHPRKPIDRSGHAGDFWLGGYERHLSDRGTGVLTSEAFPVTRPWAGFLIGGGRISNGVRLEIVDEATGEVLHQAGGRDEEKMRRVAVNLEKAMGRRIFLRLVDESTAGWGHLNFDDFVFYESAPPFAASDADERASRLHESPVLWHLQPNPAKPTREANAGAQKTVQDMMLTKGFQAELIAAEPRVHQPIAFAIDARGRLWVAEGFSYPNKQPEGEGKDRIVIFEDADGDGEFETRKVFAEGLNLVSGLEVGFGGVWVGAAPELLFIPDRDGDDKPDGPPQVLLDGWGYQDTHETLNSFLWGPDGWLYGLQGVFTKSFVGKPGAPDDQRQELRAGVWRYHPVRHEFEIFAHGGSNQWGLDFNSHGHLFMTHCRSFFGGGGTTHVIRGGHYWNQANANYAPFISNAGPDFAPHLKNYLPASARYDSGEGGAGKPGSRAVYGGHSHVGTMIYLGDNWPGIYRDHLFTHNLHGHQMNHQVNVPQGSGYETFHAGYDLLFSPDPAYIPVDLQTGPDGAVYVIDWCDLQHCHNPIDEKWDRGNGRIYRVSWAETFKPVKVDLTKLDDVELAALQTHRNDWHARHARQILQARAASGKAVDARAVEMLKKLAGESAETPLVLRALWTLHAVTPEGGDKPWLRDALSHSSDIVRAWAVQLGTERAGKPGVSPEALTRLAQNDPSPVVRLAVASALPLLPEDARLAAGAALANHAEDADDRFLPKMIWFGLVTLPDSRLPELLTLAEATPLSSLRDSILWFAAGKPSGRELLTRALLNESDREKALHLLRVMAFGLKNEAALAMPAEWPRARQRFAAEERSEARALADQLSALFGDKEVLAKTRETLANPAAPERARRQAFELLKRTGDPEALPVFVKLLDEDAYRSAVIPLLARSAEASTAAALLKHFDSLNDNDRNAALNVLTSSPAQAKTLLEAVKAGTFPKKNLTALHVRQMRNLRDAELDPALDQVWGKVGESSAEARAAIAKWKREFEEAPLWAFETSAGRRIYDRLCVTCHVMNGEGGRIGPDLTGSWRNGVEYFLENIIDPNAVVGEDFQLHIVTKKDGSVLSGTLEKETADAVVLRTLTENVTVPAAEIQTHEKLPQSLMPPGLLETLTQREVIALLKFLTEKN